uniref:Succinate dehydrogenase assembly factor 4, mitochondrial n=1 Tax=Podarcis muralis TaxID=64176 RepID=A0A670JJA0_PODMU
GRCHILKAFVLRGTTVSITRPSATLGSFQQNIKIQQCINIKSFPIYLHFAVLSSSEFPDGINPVTKERGGPKGPEPTRYGDWERKGRCIDF